MDDVVVEFSLVAGVSVSVIFIGSVVKKQEIRNAHLDRCSYFVAPLQSSN